MIHLRRLVVGIVSLVCLSMTAVFAADHNDPNAVNSIFSDIEVSAADLYDMFGWPGDDTVGGERVVIALTFASVPRTGVFDSDVLYRINVRPAPRPGPSHEGEGSLQTILDYADGIKEKYFKHGASEVKVAFNKQNEARLEFSGFAGSDFAEVVKTNSVATIRSPQGHAIKVFIGGRDDAFFNDLPGFFRSINYAPQFYHVPHTMTDTRELPIPKTLLELEGNTLFNFNPQNPKHGYGVKMDLPAGPLGWQGNRFLRDADGNFRFVYSGRDAQAGKNVNAIVLEVPMEFLTKVPTKDRIINVWGESWVLKAARKVETIPDRRSRSFIGTVVEHVGLVLSSVLPVGCAPQKGAAGDSKSGFAMNLDDYKHVDTSGVPFLDAALSEREDARQVSNNLKLVPHFVARFGHLGWGFGPSITALGLETCFDHDHSPVSVHKTYTLAAEAFPRVKKCLFQRVHMPDESWKKNRSDLKEKKTFEIFIPNVNAIDMDTTGTWPFGRRLEDQVATRFLSIFLDMEEGCGSKRCHAETLQDQSLWDHAPITPKTPPNPIKNDKPFLDEFPYLAEPWPL